MKTEEVIEKLEQLVKSSKLSESEQSVIGTAVGLLKDFEDLSQPVSETHRGIKYVEAKFVDEWFIIDEMDITEKGKFTIYDEDGTGHEYDISKHDLRIKYYED